MQGIAQYTLPCKAWALPRDALPAGQTQPPHFSLEKYCSHSKKIWYFSATKIAIIHRFIYQIKREEQNILL